MFSQPHDRQSPYTEWGHERTKASPPFPALSTKHDGLRPPWGQWGSAVLAVPPAHPQPPCWQGKNQDRMWACSAIPGITLFTSQIQTQHHTLARKINSNPASLTFMLIFKLQRTQRFLVPFCIKEYVRLCTFSTVEKYSTIYTSVTS